MENNIYTEFENIGDVTHKLNISANSEKTLLSTSKWTNFFAIISFIMIGFILFIGLFFLFARNMMLLFVPEFPYLGVLGITYIVIGVLMLFPTLYLYRFGKKIKQSIFSQDQLELEDALENMKSFWKFLGIMTIVWFGIGIVTFIIAGIAGALLM